MLKQLIPNFQRKIDDGTPEELNMFYIEVSTTVLHIRSAFLSFQQLQRGADSARSDDLNRIRRCITDWLNKTDPAPSPWLDPNCRKNRGLAHDVTGQLLCPVEFDWDNLV